MFKDTHISSRSIKITGVINSKFRKVVTSEDRKRIKLGERFWGFHLYQKCFYFLKQEKEI